MPVELVEPNEAGRTDELKGEWPTVLTGEALISEFELCAIALFVSSAS